jgi:hypothetical protein
MAWPSCHARRTVSPILPIPWESLFTMLMAPSSCSARASPLQAAFHHRNGHRNGAHRTYVPAGPA